MKSIADGLKTTGKNIKKFAKVVGNNTKDNSEKKKTFTKHGKSPKSSNPKSQTPMTEEEIANKRKQILLQRKQAKPSFKLVRISFIFDLFMKILHTYIMTGYDATSRIGITNNICLYKSYTWSELV
jgi:hypothetical protein